MELSGRILERFANNLPAKEAERAFFLAIERNEPTLLSNIAGLGLTQKVKLIALFELARRFRHWGHSHGGPSPAQLIHENSLRGNSAREKALQRIPDELKTSTHEWVGFIAALPGTLSELCVVERGVRTHVNFDPLEFFSRLLTLRPRSFFLLHNHPSGDPTPSTADYQLTLQMARLASEFNILLEGHWIVSSEKVFWLDLSLSQKMLGKVLAKISEQQ